MPGMRGQLVSGEAQVGWPKAAVPPRAEGGSGTPVPLAGGAPLLLTLLSQVLSFSSLCPPDCQELVHHPHKQVPRDAVSQMH